MKIAIVLSMLPKDLQENLYERGQVTEDLKYVDIRDHLLRLANAKAQLVKPTPMDVGWMAYQQGWGKGAIAPSMVNWTEDQYQAYVDYTPGNLAVNADGSYDTWVETMYNKGKGKGKGGKGGKGCFF